MNLTVLVSLISLMLGAVGLGSGSSGFCCPICGSERALSSQFFVTTFMSQESHIVLGATVKLR